MSWAGKIFWLASCFALIILITSRVFLGGWVSILFIPLGMFIISSLAAIIVDFKLYVEFLTLKTTKHGMNMGLMIVIFVIFLVAINFLSVMHNKTWDVTENNSNTLGVESIKVIDQIKAKFEILTFYRGEKDHAKKLAAKQIFSRYKSLNSHIKTYYFNTYTDRARAQVELDGVPVDEDMVTVIKYKNKKIKIDSPLSEETVTAAITRATRNKLKTIYFLSGHGERSLSNTKADGLLNLVNVLASKSFIVKELNLLNTNVAIPADADVIAIIGPKLELFKNEVTALKAFAAQGGKLIIAADPGKKHNINELISYFGVLFRNNFIIAEVAEMLGRSATTALGIQFDGSSKITKEIKQNGQIYSIFELASELVSLKNNNEAQFNFLPLIATSDKSFTIDELKIEVVPGPRAAKVLAIQVNNNQSNTVSAVIFGDSDFLSNKEIGLGVNQLIAKNTFSYLSGENDLITIPKAQLKGTKIILTDKLRNSVVVAGLLLPLFLFVMSGLFFYRRKGA